METLTLETVPDIKTYTQSELDEKLNAAILETKNILTIELTQKYKEELRNMAFKAYNLRTLDGCVRTTKSLNEWVDITIC